MGGGDEGSAVAALSATGSNLSAGAGAATALRRRLTNELRSEAMPQFNRPYTRSSTDVKT